MIVIESILDCESHLENMDAVIFDLDDTLYGEKEYVRSGYRAVATGFPQVDAMAEKLWDAFEKRLPAIDAVLEREGISSPETNAKALQLYRSHMPQIALYPGVRSLLGRLKGKKLLGLITDGRPEGQRAKIEALGIGDDFQQIIITDDLGGVECRKPNQAAFIRMQQLLQVPFDRMVYIGDNPQKDFVAPEALGMGAIYFKNRDGLYSG